MGTHINATDYGFNSTADLLRYPAKVIGDDANSPDLFGGAIVAIIFSTALLSTMHWGAVRSFTFASFISALSAVILFLLGIASEAVMVIPGILSIVSIILLYSTRGE